MKRGTEKKGKKSTGKKRRERGFARYMFSFALSTVGVVYDGRKVCVCVCVK